MLNRGIVGYAKKKKCRKSGRWMFNIEANQYRREGKGVRRGK